MINVLRSILSIGHAVFVWAAPNEPEGLGGISDRRSTKDLAKEPADIAEMQATCLYRILTCLGLTPGYEAFRRCMEIYGCV